MNIQEIMIEVEKIALNLNLEFVDKVKSPQEGDTLDDRGMVDFGNSSLYVFVITQDQKQQVMCSVYRGEHLVLFADLNNQNDIKTAFTYLLDLNVEV